AADAGSRPAAAADAGAALARLHPRRDCRRYAPESAHGAPPSGPDQTLPGTALPGASRFLTSRVRLPAMQPPPSSEKPVLWDAPPWERLVDAFEQAWQSGTPPAIEDFWAPNAQDAVAADDCSRRELLEELVKIDLEYRWRFRAGSNRTSPVGSQEETRSLTSARHFPVNPKLEDYVARYPELGP